MFIRHRHRSNYAIRFVSGHVFRRADTAAKKIRALAPAYGNSTPPFRSREYRCRMPHVLRDLIHCGKTQSATVRSFSGIVYRCPVSISLTTQISAARFRGSCKTTFICSLRLDTKSALNVQFNSLKADSHSAREGNSGSRHPFGNVVFQRYGFMARKLSHAFGNISLRIQSNDDWFRGQRNTPILHPTPDSNLTRYRRG